MAGSCALANSQSVGNSARFSEYGAQPGVSGVDISDVLLSLQSPGGNRLTVQPQPPQTQHQVLYQPPPPQVEPQAQVEQAVEPPSQPITEAPQSCEKKVEVNFRDNGHVVTMGVAENTTVYQRLEARSRTGGTARARGLEYDVRISEDGCSKTVAIDIFRDEPIKVVVPAKKSEIDCLWDRVYHHEMEHARITLSTPKSFEPEIRGIAENSTNPKSEMVRLIWRINEEIARRNAQFDQFDQKARSPRGCANNFKSMKW